MIVVAILLRRLGDLEPSGPLTAIGGEPPRKRKWIVLAGAILVLALILLTAFGVTSLLYSWFKHRNDPDSLAETRLVGTRGPECVRLILASDQSGSMAEFANARQRAYDQFVPWAKQNLRADDELAVVAFGKDSRIVLAPTTIPAVTSIGSAAVDGSDTFLGSVVDAIYSMPATHCRTVTVLLSDGILGDFPPTAGDGLGILQSAGIDTLFLLVPGDDIPVSEDWPKIFPYAEPRVFDGLDADETGLAFGRIAESVTGQELVTQKDHS